MVDEIAVKPRKTKNRWGPRKKEFSVATDSSSKENVLATTLSNLNLNDGHPRPHAGTRVVPHGSSLSEHTTRNLSRQQNSFRYTIKTPWVVSEILLSKLTDSVRSNQCILAAEFPTSRSSWSFTASNNCVILDTAEKLNLKDISNLREKFGNFHKKGFFLWLAGDKGWILDPEQKSWAEYLDALNKLQDVFNLMAPHAVKKQMEGSTKLLWKKEKHIQEAVFNIRQVLEVLWGLNDTNKHLTILSRKGTRNCTPHDRWTRIMTQVRKLMRRSLSGPDAPVQWAAHPACNRYGLTFITSNMIIEIIESLLIIMKNLFFGLGTDEHPHDCLGTTWYIRKDGDFPAAFKTMDGSLSDFQTPESFKKLLNRGLLASGANSFEQQKLPSAPNHEKRL